MASFYSNRSNGYRLRLDIDHSDQNIIDNTSLISWNLYLENNSYNSMNHFHIYTINIDDVVRASASGADHAINIEAFSTIKVKSGEFRTTHNDDGSKTIPFEINFRVNQVTNYTPQQALVINSSTTLRTISRPTYPIVSNGDVGVRMEIELPRKSSLFKHDVSYKYVNASGTIGENVEESISWLPDLELARQVPNSTSAPLTITVVTKLGNKVIGTTSRNVTLSVPSYFVPYIESHIVRNNDESIDQQFGAGTYIKDQTRWYVKVNASGIYGSTIKSVYITIDGKVYYGDEIVSDPISLSAGQHVGGIVVTMTDSRGHTTSTNLVLNVTNWFPPRIERFDGIRVDANGLHKDDGWNSKFFVHYTAASVDEKNTPSLRIEYADPTTGTWTTLYNVDGLRPYDPGWTWEATSDAIFNPDYSYLFRATFSDFFESVTQFYTLPTSKNVLDFKANKQGVAIGKASELDALEVDWNAHFTGDKLTHKGHDVVLKPELTWSGITDGNTSIGNAGSARKKYSWGGLYRGSSSNTGVIRINLGTSNTMFNARISLWSYNYLADISVGGYTYTAQTNWCTPKAAGRVIGGALDVRFSGSGTNRYIQIGNTNTNWGGYLHVTIDDVSVGFTPDFPSPFTVSLETSYIGTTAYTQKVGEVFHSGKLPSWGQVTGKPSTFPPASHTHSIEGMLTWTHRTSQSTNLRAAPSAGTVITLLQSGHNVSRLTNAAISAGGFTWWFVWVQNVGIGWVAESYLTAN